MTPLADALLALGVLFLWLRHRTLALDARLRRVARRARRFASTLLHLGFARPPPPRPWCRGGHNRTAPELEEAVCRLHVDRPDLGLRGLRTLMARLRGVALSPSTIRAILLRSEAQLAALAAARKKRPRSIHVRRPGVLWGIDFTLVWVLGVVPVWLLGVVDYHGSRLLLLRPVAPTSASVVAQLSALFLEVGVPSRILTDNGGQFAAHELEQFLALHQVEHTFIRPAHPWTNGRIERLFRTLKETQRRFARVFVSREHVTRFCSDFLSYYNRCRGHSSCWGFTPDEVFSVKPATAPLGELVLFDGMLVAHQFTVAPGAGEQVVRRRRSLKSAAR